MRNWPHYLARRLDRWWFRWLHLRSRVDEQGQVWIDARVNHRDPRYFLTCAWLIVSGMRVRLAIGRHSWFIWGWWHEH